MQVEETMTVRVAGPGDAEAVARIHIESWQHAYRDLMPAELLGRLRVAERTDGWRPVLADAERPTSVLEHNGQVVGFCHLCPSRDDDMNPRTTGEIAALYIHPTVCGRGLGRRLAEWAIDDLCARGFLRVVLWVLEGNAGARRFYERLGFAVDGARRLHEPSGLPMVRYARGVGGG
jgi:ribosomal protein S18 acetylase RimI-like enzyme